ncbi:DinB family protein [Spirosoma sp. BT702]|uniref:DinB family protein n=1 Tax=Spirosoma profusum TaxID=2771354 RepID=A0A926XVE0_9BACT|nr:DinB family protein [Spirosoma profusum]MBD2701344.1 DinB family protein [Spirosoma profusum]
MTRSQLNPMPVYFDRYINLCDDVTLPEAIQTSLDELDQFPLETWKALGDKVYAPGKWTVKDILQHLIDTERIFGYRALSFARGESQRMPSFEEDVYALAAQSSTRSMESLVDELRTVHLSFLSLMKSFTPDMLQKAGMGFKGEYTVAAIGFCMPGHQRWHMNVLKERYYPLLDG